MAHVWNNIYLVLGEKSYRFNHSYDELLKRLGMLVVFDTKNRLFNIKNIGLIKVYEVVYRNELNEIWLKAQILN